MSRIDAAIRRCWQEWMDSSRFQRRDGSGQPRVTENRKDRLIVRSAAKDPYASLSTVRRATHTRLSTMTLHRRLIERNLRSYLLLLHLPLMPSNCRARLQGFLARSSWNHAEWGSIVFSNESRF
ncbi:HTH_Tnp_Tc3_2 domain-containing protein [Trichonephila clavipes]|nr:HTH_Tnp_Tc3_2 domain-containing protein [Trichonephila clavipes]